MESIAVSVVAGIVLMVISWIGGRFSVKTKQQIKLDDVCADVTELKDGMKIVLQCQLASMVALKRGQVNGECDKALKALNKYLIEK